MSEVNIPRCQHIKVNGVQCGSPALRRKKFCFFHQRWRNYHKPRVGGKSTDPITWFDLPPLEDANSVQEAVMQVPRLVLCGRIDSKTAGILLYAMQIANCNLKHLTLEPDWKEVVVNPQAVRFSPIDTTSDALDTLEKENQLLSQRLLNPSAQAQNESAEAAKPCATAAAALNQKLRSRHALPTTAEDWEALKQDDFTAWMMAFSSLMMSPEQIAEMRADMREHPEKYQQDSNPDLQLLTTWGRAIEAEDRAKMGDSQ